ncbi:MAG: T9SS type A sorting domain-containing protein [Chitinophagaceae bacterium]|nr:T9SS type A sorting domain-containing protein [Chitinophagaceae bacterium]
MKKLILSLVILGSLITTSNAQRSCGSADVYQHMLQHNSEFAQQRALIEQQTADYIANPGAQQRAVVTIPVVFHIIYNTTAQNVSDAQIMSQLTVLNNDFRKLNSDASLVPAAFSGLAADCEINFCLAQQDPSGAPSTGIVRKSTTVTSFSTNDAMKYTAQGGDNIWDRNKYLNIWVCNLSGGILGYAQFPGGPAATDGVVITYTGFGTMGTASAPFNKGRTATHEVGHWLNLFHIWGDDGSACTGSDQVGDTPNQGAENYGCPAFPHVSCSNGPNGDMFMNYMDYTDDACMYMFSAGQKSRMSALFTGTGARVSLLTSPGCTPGNTTTCGVPSSLAATGITSTGATLTWGAVANATSYSVQYKLSSATTWTTTTATTTSLTLSGLSSSSTYNYQVSTNCASGSSAYSAASSFTTSAPAGSCSNNYESNNTRATAATIPINTNISSMIGSNGDKDYFKITTTTAQPKLQVTLTTLPFDYDMRLYNASGTLIASSVASGTTNEIIKYNTATVGSTYYIYVYGYNGAFSATQCYTLNASTSATNWRLDGSENSLSDKTDLTIYPNPVSDKLTVQYFATAGTHTSGIVYNSIGQRVVTTQEEAIEGENKLTINTRELKNGIYILELINDGERSVQRFVVEQ